MKITAMIPAAALTLIASVGFSNEGTRAQLCRDREAIERVYHTNRTAANVPFETALSRADIERLVDRDLQKEALLRREYGVAVSAEEVAAEVRRIETSTRAPELLAKLKAALGNDSPRFARSVARPMVVERDLQARTDERFNGARRRELEVVRTEWLQARANGASAEELIARARKLRNATVYEQAFALSSGESSSATTNPVQLVLSVQLRQPGDISAVLDTPEAFQIFIATARSSDTLETLGVTLPKMDWRTWLATQTHLNSKP